MYAAILAVVAALSGAVLVEAERTHALNETSVELMADERFPVYRAGRTGEVSALHLRPTVPGEDLTDCPTRKRLLSEAATLERQKATISAVIGDDAARDAAQERFNRLAVEYRSLRCW